MVRDSCPVARLKEIAGLVPRQSRFIGTRELPLGVLGLIKIAIMGIIMAGNANLEIPKIVVL